MIIYYYYNFNVIIKDIVKGCEAQIYQEKLKFFNVTLYLTFNIVI